MFLPFNASLSAQKQADKQLFPDCFQKEIFDC